MKIIIKLFIQKVENFVIFMENLKKLQDIEIDLSNFDKKEKIGKGASSKVYKICEKDNEKVYSAKIFIKEIDENNENRINSLINEISIL